jgi:hypothetical protein
LAAYHFRLRETCQETLQLILSGPQKEPKEKGPGFGAFFTVHIETLRLAMIVVMDTMIAMPTVPAVVARIHVPVLRAVGVPGRTQPNADAAGSCIHVHLSHCRRGEASRKSCSGRNAYYDFLHFGLPLHGWITRGAALSFRALGHEPEKWKPVFRKDHGFIKKSERQWFQS